MVEYLNYAGIQKKFENDQFYIASFTSDETGRTDRPYTDTPPYIAHVEFCKSTGKIIINSREHGIVNPRNLYFKYIVSDNLEELQNFYESLKREWIGRRLDYLQNEMNWVESYSSNIHTDKKDLLCTNVSQWLGNSYP